MEFHCDKFSIQCTWLSIIKCLWQVENILKYLTLFKVILICLMNNNQFSFVTQSWIFMTPWTVACQASLPTINSQSLLKLMLIELVMSSNHLILCHPLLLLPSIFSCESVLHIPSPFPLRSDNLSSLAPNEVQAQGPRSVPIRPCLLHRT